MQFAKGLCPAKNRMLRVQIPSPAFKIRKNPSYPPKLYNSGPFILCIYY